MKKVLMFVVFLFAVLLNVACNNNSKEDFLKTINDSTCYKATGIMESFYKNGRKQNEFTVWNKSNDYIKVSLKSVDSEEEQIILKNKDGVYILIPSVNKNFKIQSSWPVNASYPYLLQSLAKDLANTKDGNVTEDDKSVTYETETHIFKDANSNRQKIITSKETGYPTEVLIYDEQGDLYIRVVYNKIELDCSFKDEEFIVDNTMDVARMEYEDDFEYTDRVVSYPSYCPEGMKLSSENIQSSTDGKEVLSIMKFSNEEKSFTLIQEYINDTENKQFVMETGEVVHVLGNTAILKENSVILFYEGIEYTIASNDITTEEMISVLESFMKSEEK